MTSNAQALSTENVPSVQEVTRKVLQAVNGYASAISCVESSAKAKDIAALKPYKTIDNAYDAQYLVFWDGDIGCAGGSGTTSFNAALVHTGAGGTFIVDPLRSSPVIDLEFNTRLFERLVGNTENTLVVEAGEFAENDSNCCPTLHFRYTLRIDDKGNWKLVEKKPVQPKQDKTQ